VNTAELKWPEGLWPWVPGAAGMDFLTPTSVCAGMVDWIQKNRAALVERVIPKLDLVGAVGLLEVLLLAGELFRWFQTHSPKVNGFPRKADFLPGLAGYVALSPASVLVNLSLPLYRERIRIMEKLMFPASDEAMLELAETLVLVEQVATLAGLKTELHGKEDVPFDGSFLQRVALAAKRKVLFEKLGIPMPELEGEGPAGRCDASAGGNELDAKGEPPLAGEGKVQP